MENKTCKAQLLRSVSAWSIGFPADMVENSIHKAYIHHIGQARHFIYIENQYFMSSYDTIDCPLKNKIAEALFNRILIAHLNHENFKVFVVIPLYPGNVFYNYLGYAGDFAEPSQSAILRSLFDYERLTLGHGQFSLLGKLELEGIDPSDHIQILALRTHDCVNDIPLTELVYVHSKAFVIDDKYALIGSANINDRSMLGFRDSELAVNKHVHQ